MSIVHNVVGERSFTLDLPMPPSVNRRHHRFGNSSREVVRWRKQANAILMAQGPLPAPLNGKFHATITWDKSYYRYDIDNAVKPLLDYLQYLELITNDAKCRKLTVSFGVAKEGCRITCVVMTELQ